MDIPLLRMAEAYLIVAEASIRANNGVSTQETIDAMHEIRKRANAAESDSYTLTDIRDEWAREFWFEGRRRIDLIVSAISADTPTITGIGKVEKNKVLK